MCAEIIRCMSALVGSLRNHAEIGVCVLIGAMSGYALFAVDLATSGWWLDMVFLVAICLATVKISAVITRSTMDSMDRDLTDLD